jgi:hypothetical protein
MSFKDNMKAKIRLDGIFRQLIFTMKEPPGKWWLWGKILTRELFNMTDFFLKKFECRVVKACNIRIIRRNRYENCSQQ